MAPSEDTVSGTGKRARLACLNCRRKKVRCSGRQPVCDLCRRVSQRCQYTARGEAPVERGITGANRSSMELLGERMDLIEGKLEEIMDMLTAQRPAASFRGRVDSTPSSASVTASASAASVVQADSGAEAFASTPEASPARGAPFSTRPSFDTLLSAADVYFKYCHNQPYAVFHEQSFRDKLANDTLPTHLMLAFLATAIRFSPDPQFGEDRFRAIEAYAAQSWKSIVLPWNGLESAAEVSTVQAILLLGVLDFTDGRCQGAWIKIGLGIRIAHHLQLMKEPPPHLPPVEREERRKLFWSFYVLDRLISCSTEQSPTIAEQTCELQLPCDEEVFERGLYQEMPTLDQISGGELSLMCLGPNNPIALLVVVSSMFAQCAQDVLKEYKHPRQLAPWDSRSNFCKSASFLLKIEQVLCSSPPLVDVIHKGRAVDSGEVKYSRVGPLVYVHCLFHVARCLLHHPFLLRQRLANLGEKQAPPLSFLNNALHLYLSHARAFTELLEDVKQAGYTPQGSFYGFFNTTAGVAHAILTQSEDIKVAEDAKKNFGLCLDNLVAMSRYWPHATLMIPVLDKAFAMSDRLRDFLHPSQLTNMQLDTDDVAFLWETVDNTCLTTRKDQRFYYHTSLGGEERPGNVVKDSQGLAQPTFPSPLLDELADLSSLINSGILSPNLAQQLSFAQPAMADNGSNSNANPLANAENIFDSHGYPTGLPTAHISDPPMSSQALMQQHAFLDANFRSWGLGTDEVIGNLLPQYYHQPGGAS